MKHFALILSLAFTIQNANAAWQGEWAHWEKLGKGFKGAGLKLTSCDEKSCAFTIASEDGAGHSCGASGKLSITSETEARGKFDSQYKTKSCSLTLTQLPENKLKTAFEGSDCLRLCTSEKAKALPGELARLSETPFIDVLPWPECQTDERMSVKGLCLDEKLGKDFIEATKAEAKAKALQLTFYVAKSQQFTPEEDPLTKCLNPDGQHECLEASVAAKLEAANKGLATIRSLKNKHEGDLKTTAKNKAAIEALKGSYARKFKSGTTSGDKFDATDDAKLSAEEDDLAFDVLLNFFDEQECTLSGLAKPTKNGRFLFKDSGKGKGGDKNCKLVIFKEGEDLVFADDPPNSCKSHCGKGGSFFGARFPLSSKK